MADKTYTWDNDFLDDDPNEDTGLVRYSGRYVNQTREALDERLKDEHDWDVNEPAPQTKMGMHKSGSGISYYGTVEPTLRPDGVTSLDTDDVGRLWFDSGNGQINGWNGTAWVNLSAQGIGTILRWQSSAQYSEDEVVESTGYLWRANVALPAVGVAPTEPEWQIYSVGMPDDIVWIEKLTYVATQLTYYAGLFWVAVSPVLANPPGTTPGEWVPLELATQSIKDDAITTAKILDANVTTDKINDLAVTTGKINDLAVTAGKLGALAVETAKIDDLAVTEAKIGLLAVTNAKIADDTITLAKFDESARGLAIWQSTYTYVQNELVNYSGTWWKVVPATATVGVAPADGSGDWIRWTDQTNEAVSNTATIGDGFKDHTVFADTSVNPSYVVTLPDGYAVNDKITLAVFGGGEVQVTATGLTDQTQTDNAIEYIWSGTAWLPLGGGSGSSIGLALGEVTWLPSPTATALPEGKLVCDGSIVNIADYASLFGRLGTTWGGNGTTTFGLPDLQGIFPGALGTQDINGNTKGDGTAVIGDYKEDQMQQIVGEAGANDIRGILHSDLGVTGAFVAGSAQSYRLNGQTEDGFNLGFDSADSVGARTGDHTDVSRAIGRWVIQAEPSAPQEINAVVVDVEIGDVRWNPHSTVGDYDKVCNGASLLVASYPDLYAKLGYTWGGSGANFNLPDLQGIFPGALGTQDINGNTKGDGTAVIGDVKEDQMQQITGGFSTLDRNFDDSTGAFTTTLYPSTGGTASGSDVRNNQQIGIDSASSPNARTGDHGDVSRAIGQWIIRVLNPAVYTVPVLGPDDITTEMLQDGCVTQEKLDPSIGVDSFLSFSTERGQAVKLSSGDTVLFSGVAEEKSQFQGTGSTNPIAPPSIPGRPPTIIGEIKEEKYFGANGYILTESGDFWVWGANRNNQIGDGGSTEKLLPYLTMTGVNKVWAARRLSYRFIHISFIIEKSDGSYWAVGHNSDGNLGVGTTVNLSVWTRITFFDSIPLKDIYTAESWGGYTFFVSEAGSIYFTGSNTHGVAGNGTSGNVYSTPIDVTTAWGGLEGGSAGSIINISGITGEYTTSWSISQTVAMLRADGVVRTCGYNSHGGCGDGSLTLRTTPHSVSLPELIVEAQIYLGKASVIARAASGKIYRWGFNGDYRLGDGTTVSIQTPYNSGDGDDIDNNCSKLLGWESGTDIYASQTNIFLKDSRDDSLWTCGQNSQGACGVGTLVTPTEFVQVFTRKSIIDMRIAMEASTQKAYYALTEDGKVLFWGSRTINKDPWTVATHVQLVPIELRLYGM